jgi:phosphate-selective porin OprO/OprP
MKIKNKAAGMLFLLLSNGAFAVESSGLMYGSKSDPYWFKVGGAVKVDHTRYFGNTKNSIAPKGQGNYYSGTMLRETSLKFEGGLGTDYQMTINFMYNGAKETVSLDEAYVTYLGFRDLLPNFSISLGQVNPGFCLESTSSSKWIPFMEKSLGSGVFGPHPGLGLSVNTYNKQYSLTVAATNPKPSSPAGTDLSGNRVAANDHGLYSARLTYSPINHDANLIQIGVSTHYTDRNNSGIAFSVAPESKARNSVSLLNTTGSNGVLIAAKDQFAYDIELMAQRGPLYAEAEFQTAKITRGTMNNAVQGKDLTFYGYHAQVAYVLTGEARKRSDATATLGQIIPQHKYGAVEAAVRYSHLNLNSQDIFGGKADNITVSLSWYPNQNLRFIAEYLNSNQKRMINGNAATNLKMNVNSVAGRVQFIF